MEQFLAILLVAAVAAAFYGVSYLKKRSMHPDCDRFALQYCELADRLLDETNIASELRVTPLSGGLYQILPLEQQALAIQKALQKPIDPEMLTLLRELFMLRDEIQSKASNGSFAKDKYNAITNQVYESINLYLSVLKDPSQVLSQKDIDQIHYFYQKQQHIRNVTLRAIVSNDCAEKIAI